MKNNVSNGISAFYLLAVFAEFEREQHHFYALLLSGKIITVNSTHDNRVYTLREFLEAADTFHKNDRFTIALPQVDITLDSNTEFNPDILECICTEELRHHCKMNLYTDRPITIAHAPEISEEDATRLTKLIYAMNADIMNDLQLQYDTLKKLPFIEP